jgi:hypothetical protein
VQEKALDVRDAEARRGCVADAQCDERFTETACPVDTPYMPLAAPIRPAVSARATRGSGRCGTG